MKWLRIDLELQNEQKRKKKTTVLFKTSLSSSSHSPESPVFLTTCTTWGQSRWGPHHVDDVRMVCETQSWPHLFLLDLSPLPASSGHGSVSPTNRRGHGSTGYKQAEALQVNSASLESLQHPDSICFRSLFWGHLRMRCALWPNFAKFPETQMHLKSSASTLTLFPRPHGPSLLPTHDQVLLIFQGLAQTCLPLCFLSWLSAGLYYWLVCSCCAVLSCSIVSDSLQLRGL